MPNPSDAPPAIPPENGKRATIDPVTGEVRGSGMGAGGGSPGEDMDDETSGDEPILPRGG